MQIVKRQFLRYNCSSIPGGSNEIERLNELLVNDENIGEIDIHLSQMLVSRPFRDEINYDETLDENTRIILLIKMRACCLA